MRRRWQIALKRVQFGTKDTLWEPKSNDVVCSKHFKTDDFRVTGKRKRLKAGAVPNVKDWIADGNVPKPASEPRPSPDSLKRKLKSLQETSTKRYKALTNVKKREKRLRETVKDLLAELNDVKLINEDLCKQLSDLKGNLISLSKVFRFLNNVTYLIVIHYYCNMLRCTCLNLLLVSAV